MDVNHIREFVEFSKYLSVMKTAEALFMSKSALSKHIAQIEKEVGYQLIEHAGSKFHLTVEGEIYCNAFSSALAALQEADLKCHELQSFQKDTILIQSPSYYDNVAAAVNKLAVDLRAHNPLITVRYRNPQRKKLFEELVAGRMDIAIVQSTDPSVTSMRHSDGTTMVAKLLSQDSLAIWCGESHRFAAMESVPLSELETEPILAANDIYSPWRTILTTYCRDAGIQPCFKVVESESPSTFLTLSLPGAVYAIPGSAKEDVRVKSRNDMVLRPLQEGKITFYSYAVVTESRMRESADLTRIFVDEPSGVCAEGFE